MSNVKKILRRAATTSDLLTYSWKIHNLSSEALAKGISDEQLVILLANYIGSLASTSEQPELLVEIAYAQIKKSLPST